ncbi:hypothetical protein TVAG_065770 [Trichomonas vaginalis G3]|uniref:Uncharacterized protein n=1 Tax=Trichomonas vaginalis (strain ATCC PRA-98 / G3) TaxID=412133 RepID=A2ELY1_TRIV3|nr:armadillo (ARM) repeat-containing protein family [Trichomonas vaginalis G3]EAY06320.1 hypothetical protein TVAG_065770 [Trichomonas vaginalis G3]KAI5489856.1 armadillo (ARM) repeat-containing protein family [Trichomonas vaginalis G3]|eukprot:XP_001318543.1 hypothetical protein [Trichomonas vaginalis G3]
MYLVQISFSETKYNTTKVDEFKVVHNSGILAKSLNINLFNSIVDAACKAILSSSDDLLVEYSIKALESISLYQNSADIIFENNIIEKLLQMLNEDTNFETKASITNLLCNLIYISFDLAKILKDNGFYDYIGSAFENIIVQSGKHILNALIKSIEYIELDNSFEECVRNGNIINTLSLIAYDEEYSEVEDEFGNLLSELSSTVLDLLDIPDD